VQILAQGLNKPRMPEEVRQILERKPTSNLSTTFQELQESSVLWRRPKGLYGLTKLGEQIRKRLLRDNEEGYSYTQPRLCWDSYTWIIRGAQRKSLLEVLKPDEPTRASRLLRLAREAHPRFGRTNVYDLLRSFVARTITEKSEGRYQLTLKGRRIRRQMLI